MNAQKLNSVNEGSLVLFRGQLIGKVSEVKFDGKNAFNLEIFIFEPFDKLNIIGINFDIRLKQGILALRQKN